jgi:stage III sporulation protein AF
MDGILSTWAIAVTAAILLSAILSSLLPETSIKKYITVVMGVVVTMIILSPVIALFSGADIEQEMKDTLSSIESASTYEYDSSLYKDYIYKLYESYIENE